MKQTPATVLGFSTASLVPAIYLATVHPLSGLHDLLSVLGSLIVFYAITSVFTVVFGVPIFLVANKLKLVAWWSAIGCGALVGVAGLFALTLGVGVDLKTSLTYATLGGGAGFVFWMFWRAGRKSKSKVPGSN